MRRRVSPLGWIAFSVGLVACGNGPVAPSNGAGGEASSSSKSGTGSVEAGSSGQSAGGALGVAGGVGVAGSLGGMPPASGGGAGASTAGFGANAGAGGATAGSASSNGGAGSGGSPSEDATLVPDPSWTCGMPDGIVPPSQGELAFTATLELGTKHDVGETQYGHRRVLDVKGGTLKGARVQGTFLTGGLELELALSNGASELEGIDLLRASDGTLIYLRSCGVAPSGSSGRVVLDFEVATASSLSWLNTGKFVATRALDATAGSVQLTVYDVSKVSPSEPKIRLTDPSGTPNQPWDCSTNTGSRGASVFSESVLIGSSLSVGASKRGTRNVIPITGGTTSGRLTGSVLVGGADYQLIGGSAAKLDARYTLSTNDGELIVVRNCGPIGALVPWFEARAAGPYAFLNQNSYLSSDPGSATGGVSITFYERK